MSQSRNQYDFITVTPSMKLQRPTHNRKKWWIWTASADFADEIPKSEIFAIKFATDESKLNVRVFKS